MVNRRMRKARQAAMHTQVRSQHRALKRIAEKQGEIAFLHAWLVTKPPEEQVERYVDYKFLQSPLRDMVIKGASL